jgi:hypothetical protein
MGDALSPRHSPFHGVHGVGQVHRLVELSVSGVAAATVLPHAIVLRETLAAIQVTGPCGQAADGRSG